MKGTSKNLPRDPIAALREGVTVFGGTLKWVGLFIFCRLVLAMPMAVAAPTMDKIVAIVNDEIITLSELEEAVSKTEIVEKRGTLSLEERKELLGRLTQKKRLLQEARVTGTRLTDPELESALSDIQDRNQFSNREMFRQALAKEAVSWEHYTNNLRDELTILKLTNRMVESDIVISDEAVRAYYDAHEELFQLPAQVKMKQLLLPVSPTASPEEKKSKQKEADALLMALRAGGSFEEVGKTYQQSGVQVTELGVFNRGDLAPQIDNVVFRLKEGVISPAIESPTGFYIFRVEERKSLSKVPLAEVRKEVESLLAFERIHERRQKWVDQLMEGSFVEIK